MPFYIVKDMKVTSPELNPNILEHAATGEFMKAGLITKPEGEGPPLHMHPNEEQWTYVVSGKMQKKTSLVAMLMFAVIIQTKTSLGPDAYVFCDSSKLGS